MDLQISDHSSSLNDRPAKRHLPRPLFAQPNDLTMPIVELLPNHQLKASDSVVLDAPSLGPYEFYSARSTFWKLFMMNSSKKGLEKINNPEHFSWTSTSKTKKRKESKTNKFHQEKPNIHRSLLAQPPLAHLLITKNSPVQQKRSGKAKLQAASVQHPEEQVLTATVGPEPIVINGVFWGP